MDYCDYITNQWYEDQEHYSKMADRMVEEGLDPSDPDECDRFAQEYDEYLRSLHQDCEKV